MDSSPAGPNLAQGAGSSPWGLIIFYLILVLGAMFFAAAETALSKVNRIRMMSYNDDGDKRAKRVLYILDNFDNALTTILVCINLFHVGCASVATLFVTGAWGDGAVGASTAVTTVLLFFFAEVLPKSYAATNSDKISLRISGVMVLLMRVLTPIAFVYRKLGQLMLKPFKKSMDDEVTVTEDEFHDIMETVAKEGSLDEDRTELMQSALDFSYTTASAVLTPWDKVLYVKTDMPSDQIVDIIRHCTHSRLPVLDADGRVVGILQIRKYLKEYIKRDGKLPIYRVMDKPHFISDEAPIDNLLESLSQNKTHIAIVRDSKHKPLGIVTVEDILEELVGEIYDEDDEGVAE